MSADTVEGPTYHDQAAERILLAAAIQSKTARQEARRHITGSDFWKPAHEVLWDVMASLDRAGTTVDAVTVMAAVQALPKADRRGPDLGIHETVVALVGIDAHPDAVADYARIVHDYATRRRMDEFGTRVRQHAWDLSRSPAGLASQAISILTGIRDQGQHEDITALTLTELMAQEDDTPEWVIPDLLERGDRLMLTGSEGAGKSAVSRQLGIMAAAGVHPFTEAIMPPIRVAYIDCENKASQVKRQTRPLLHWLHDQGADSPMDRVMVDTVGRVDLTRDRDLNRMHMLLDAFQPDLVAIGPLYRTTPHSLNDEEVAAAITVALDSITARGAALIVEAHAGHGTSGTSRTRDLRPRGSSSLMGWPEFGLGLRALPHGYADLEPWRGGRENRAWPTRMHRAAGHRWVESRPDDQGARLEPRYEPAAAPYDPQGTLVP